MSSCSTLLIKHHFLMSWFHIIFYIYTFWVTFILFWFHFLFISFYFRSSHIIFIIFFFSSFLICLFFHLQIGCNTLYPARVRVRARAHTHTHRPSLALSVLQTLSERVMEPKCLLVSTLIIHTDPHDTHTHTHIHKYNIKP